MTGQWTDRNRMVFLIAAAAFAILGILNMLDQRNSPYDGYITDGDNTVIRIDAGGPAERAGLRAGDRIHSIDGIPVEDRRTLAQRDRPRIGEATTLGIEHRNGGAVDGIPVVLSLKLDHGAPPRDYAARSLAAYFIGLCFLLCGLVACFKVPNRSGVLCAFTGLCLGATFFGMPYFSSNVMRVLSRGILTMIFVLGFAFLLHLMLEYPRRKTWLQRKHALKILYGPATVIALYLIFLIVVEPQATSGLNLLSMLLTGLFALGYFGGAAVAMIHSYAKATPEERTRYGLHVELAGILLGILPVTIELLARILFPRVTLPGSDFYYLTIVFVPIALAAAILHQRNAPGFLVAGLRSAPAAFADNPPLPARKSGTAGV
jgi:hypothetical protein